MSKRILLLAALAPFWIGMASAQDKPAVLPSEVEAIQSCLKKPDGDARDCIGQQSNPCMSTPEGQSTVGMGECIMREQAVWDRILNERYTASVKAAKAVDADLGDRSEPGAFASLQAAQRSWIAFRDAECDRIYAFWRGGTIRSTNFASCMLEITAERAIDVAPVEN